MGYPNVIGNCRGEMLRLLWRSGCHSGEIIGGLLHKLSRCIRLVVNGYEGTKRPMISVFINQLKRTKIVWVVTTLR